MLEFKMLDVDALQTVNQLLNRGLIGIVAIQELRREAQRGAVEREVDRIRRLRRKIVEIELKLLRRGQCYSSGGQRQKIPFHRVTCI